MCAEVYTINTCTDFKKCSVASSVKQSGRSAATHKASFARRRHRRNLQLDLAVTLAPGVKRMFLWFSGRLIIKCWFRISNCTKMNT